MKFGYACLNTTTKLSFRTCRLITAKIEGISIIKKLSLENLKLIEENIKWNLQHNILFYRFTSNVIPFATHDIMKKLNWEWWKDPDILKITNNIKKLVESNDIRLSVHPGQYSPLNTLNVDVLKTTLDDFEYHDKLLTLTGGRDMIIHTGGVYGDKEDSKLRFAERYNLLSNSIKLKLRLENDDKSFTVKDVLDISNRCGIPICLDIHHHLCNPNGDIKKLFPLIMKTWNGFGTPKSHISSGKNHKIDNAHANFINNSDLIYYLSIIGNYDIDIMFESKMKELSVLNLINYQKI